MTWFAIKIKSIQEKNKENELIQLNILIIRKWKQDVYIR